MLKKTRLKKQMMRPKQQKMLLLIKIPNLLLTKLIQMPKLLMLFLELLVMMRPKTRIPKKM